MIRLYKKIYSFNNGKQILEIMTGANFAVLWEVIDFHVTNHVAHAATRIHYIFY